MTNIPSPVYMVNTFENFLLHSPTQSLCLREEHQEVDVRCNGNLINANFKLITRNGNQIHDILSGYPRVLPEPTILISPMLSHSGPDKNARI